MAAARKWISLSVLLLIALVGAIWGYLHWRHIQVFVSTENAYVKGHIYSISSRIQGTLLTVDVADNEAVKAGQTIATIDPKDFDAAVAKAQATLNESAAALAANQATIAQTRAQVEALKSQLNLARIEMDRASALFSRQSIPKQNYDRAATTEQVAEAQVTAAQKQVAAAEAALGVSTKKVETSRASLDEAQLKRSYCTVVSPVDGEISRKSAETGQVVAPGQPLCAVVPLDLKEIWVEANFKETQLKNVRPGQKVKLWADIDKRRTFTGSVESISAGTGAVFSSFPRRTPRATG